jgi:hypothetical protein
MSQTSRILTHLKKKTRNKNKKSLTPVQAIVLFRCYRLAARISELRGKGYNISTEIIKRGGKRYAKYTLEA